jgi:DNA-binding transcriptional MerR regulator
MSEHQTPLFDDHAIPPQGYSGPQACQYADITYRQLDYWTRTNLISPELQPATGSGTYRLYSFRDIVLLRVIKGLLDAGMTLAKIRQTMKQLRTLGVRDLTSVTLISDGTNIYEVVDDTQLLDLLHGGQGMFALGLSGITRNVAELVNQPVVDDLAQRRQLRRAQRQELLGCAPTKRPFVGSHVNTIRLHHIV